MNKEIRNQIINLSKFVFSDQEYNKAMIYLKSNNLNNLRLFIDEKYEYLDALCSLDSSDNVLGQQLIYCDELENIVMDAYLITK